MYHIIWYPDDRSAEENTYSQQSITVVYHGHDYCVPPRPLRERYEAALARIEELEKLLTNSPQKFCLQRFGSDPSLIIFYTGFKDYPTLYAVFTALKPTARTMIRWGQVQRNRGRATRVKGDVFRNECLPLIDHFFLFLCRVRVGLFEQDLAVRFSISQSSVSRILSTWSNYLYCILGSMPIWASRQVIDSSMPQSFKVTYPLTRVIIDCTEIRVQTPSSKVLNSEVYSNYKSHTTFKSLVGISPNGAVTFVSRLYCGSISDKSLTSQCGIVDLLESGDEVMADKGFLIEDILIAKNVSLVIPPFLGLKGQFSKEEVAKTHVVARLRIHIERAIRRVKEYHIFDATIPLSLAGSINQMWTVCCLLTNFKGPLF